ncbi:Tn3 family transposase [Nonomuraea lactucae]|uniref:Tn3 family transposase n=1 Tax=Nonomuraea lactucae TaxID=2249762 RepID=UPI0013B44B71|nr:Tn3 family transposase [Nonomuraea lactucae]
MTTHQRYQAGDHDDWHVERRSVCIYSQVTSTTASEVASMIKGLLLPHLTDAEIDRQYTGIHGASVVGFAFSELLGFRLLPGRRTSARRGCTGPAWVSTRPGRAWRRCCRTRPSTGT